MCSVLPDFSAGIRLERKLKYLRLLFPGVRLERDLGDFRPLDVRCTHISFLQQSFVCMQTMTADVNLRLLSPSVRLERGLGDFRPLDVRCTHISFLQQSFVCMQTMTADVNLRSSLYVDIIASFGEI